MKLAKIMLPTVAAVAISALSMVSCSANRQSNVQSQPKTETVIKQAPPADTYEKQQTEEKKEELPWWGKCLAVIGSLAVTIGGAKLLSPNLEKLAQDKEGARTYCRIVGEFEPNLD